MKYNLSKNIFSKNIFIIIFFIVILLILYYKKYYSNKHFSIPIGAVIYINNNPVDSVIDYIFRYITKSNNSIAPGYISSINIFIIINKLKLNYH